MPAKDTPTVRVTTENHPRKRGKRYVVTFTSNKVRQRRYFETEKAAKAERKRLRDDINKAGAAWIALKAKERADIISVLHEVQEAELTLRKVWNQHQELMQLMKRASKPLQEALELFLRDMKENDRSGPYVESLREYLTMFIRGRETLLVDRIGKGELEEWFRDRGESGMVKASNMGRLQSFFDFCRRSKWLLENPVTLLTRPTIRGKVPVILTEPQFKRVLFVCYWKFSDYFPYLLLTLVCGIRPEEAEELEWRDVDLKNQTITVSKTSAADKRTIPVEDTMMYWLNLCRPGAPNDKIALKNTTLRRRRHALFEAAKIPAIQDIMRHTAGSLLFAYWQNFEAKEVTVLEKATRVLGNGSRSFFKHYRHLIPPSDGRRIWEWRPRLKIPERLIPPHTRAARLLQILECDLGRSHAKDLEQILTLARRMGLNEFSAWVLDRRPEFQRQTALEWLKEGKSRKVLAALREFQAARAS